MSYILEALKKLEQKREQEELPKVVTFSHEASTKQAKRRIWPYPLAAALLLNAGVMVWLMRGAEVKDVPVAAPKVSQPNEIGRPGPTPGPAPEQHQAKQAAPATRQERESGSTGTAKTAIVERAAPEPQARKEPAPLPQHQTRKEKTLPPAESRPPRELRPVPTEQAYTFKELPPFIRNDLPEFKVSGHAYSPQPQNRVTRINDRILQEGEELSAGLRLEEIIPDGVILSYQGYRFRIGVTLNR